MNEFINIENGKFVLQFFDSKVLQRKNNVNL